MKSRVSAFAVISAGFAIACTHDVVLPDVSGDEATCGDGIVQPGEECDVASDGCVSCEVAPGWTCNTSGCQIECGDGVVSSDASCSNPTRDTACDLTGYWSIRETDYARDTVLQSIQVSSNWFLYHVTQTGNDFVVDQELDCGIHVTGSATVDYTPGGLRGILYENRMDDPTSPHGLRHGTSTAVAGGCAVTLDRWYSVRGAETSYLPADFSLHQTNQELTPLPVEADPVNGTDTPAGTTDEDGDGIPGVSFDVGGFVTGVRNSAQRTWKEYATLSGAPVAASALTFIVPGGFDVQENVMRVTQCGNACSLLASPANSAQGVPGKIAFAFIGKTFGSARVSAVVANVPRADINDDLTTCANARLLLPHDATDPTATP